MRGSSARHERAPTHAPPRRLPEQHVVARGYSTRIATIGSTRSARRVGTMQASRHTPIMNAV